MSAKTIFTTGLITLSIFGTNKVTAQKHAVNTLTFSVGSQYYLRGNSTKSDLDVNFAPLNVANKFGYNVMAGAQRVTSSNIVLSADAVVGTSSFNVKSDVPLDNYDAEATASLKGRKVLIRENFNNTYVGLRLMAGYDFKLRNKIGIIAKGGISQKVYTNAHQRSFVGISDYVTDNGESRTGQTLYTYNDLGKTSEGKKSLKWGQSCYEVYLGVYKELGAKSLINKINLGVEVTRYIDGLSTNMTYILHTNTYGNALSDYYPIKSSHEFTDKNFCIGLRAGIEF